MENLNTYKTKVVLNDGSTLEIDCLYEGQEHGLYSFFDGKTKKQYILPLSSIKYIEFYGDRAIEMAHRRTLEMASEKEGATV